MPTPDTLPAPSASLKATGLRHIAIIMDGNRRWAKGKLLPAAAGHAQGVKALKNLVQHAGKIGLEALTVYAFSTENWRRTPDEVSTLMGLLAKSMADEVGALHQNGVRLKFIGDTSALNEGLQQAVQQAEALTANNHGLKLQVALNYGSRQELVRACQQLVQEAQNGQLDPSAISEADIERCLDTAHLPDPDLLIRTGGEYRLSNYLLWQCAYAELYVTDALWPDFTPERLDEAIDAYATRQRRFGQ